MDNDKTEQDFLRQIDIKEKRKIKAKKTKDLSVWKHIGTFGLVGWSISCPTILGVAIGWFIDKQNASHGHSWTMFFLITGLMVGCLNAYYWVFKEYEDM